MGHRSYTVDHVSASIRRDIVELYGIELVNQWKESICTSCRHKMGDGLFCKYNLIPATIHGKGCMYREERQSGTE